jgi:hypothetical protein
MQVIEKRAFARQRNFLREALAGSDQDYTEGSLSRGIALLARVCDMKVTGRGFSFFVAWILK